MLLNRNIFLKTKLTISAGLLLCLVIIFQYTAEILEEDKSKPFSAAYSPADLAPLSPRPADTASIKQHQRKITSNIQNEIEDEAAVMPPVTRSQLADFDGYSESDGQTNKTSQPRISEQDPSMDAGFLGIDDSEPYPNWEPPSDQYFIESTAHGADIVDEYENGNTYEDWQPINRVETGFAAQAGYEQ